MGRDEVLNPRVFRKVLPTVELYTTDVSTGKKIKKMVFCSYHKRYEWIADFYIESESKAKHSNDIRSMCIEAWDITHGALPKEDKQQTATLFEFI
jgi:hypothetical protein